MSQIHHQSPGRSRSSQSDARPLAFPPVPAGMPVRADGNRAKQTSFTQPPSQSQSQSKRGPGAPGPQGHYPSHTDSHQWSAQQHHRQSMLPPATRLIEGDSKRHLPRASKQIPASISSRPSPNLSSSGSSNNSLRETSRTNIRGSMPPPRQPSATLAWDSVGSPSPKEQWLATPKEQWEPQVKMRDEVELHFDHLLDSLQVPATVRQKFSTVSPDVKSSILASTLTSNPAILSSLGLPLPQPVQTPKVKKRMSTPLLRKAKSSASLNSPGQSPQVGKTYSVEGDSFVIVASPNPDASPRQPQRGQSFDVSRPGTVRHSNGPDGRPLSMGLFGPSSSSGSVTSIGKAGGKGLGINMGEQPDAFIHWLGNYKATDLKMEVARMKKLRMLLRHESTSWVGAFIAQGGYKLIIARLQDLLDVEWREEQHDDQMLYELLRCVKALSTSEIGKTALRSAFPNPFTGLSTLLFSEKKPGDLPSRQIIIELWLFLFDLFPPILSQVPGGRATSIRFDQAQTSAEITSQIRRLLVPDLPDPTKDHHDFVTQAHRPRVFKSWVGELSDICRDYFWVMCHASNTLWLLEQVDESLVEKPTAPSGATGGVEFEAMNYVTIHFKLLNALCKRQADEDPAKALQLHSDLLASGMDRILVTLRKASTTYYPTLHLELARYVSLLQAVSPNGKLPYLMSKMVGPPPEEVRKLNTRESGWLPMPVHVGANGARRNAYDGH